MTTTQATSQKKSTAPPAPVKDANPVTQPMQKPVPELVADTSKAESIECTQNTFQKAKKRKSKAEQLEIALARKQALQVKIDALKAELNENDRKTRNRGLMLVGIVIEQALKNKALPDTWLEQLLSWSTFLPDKDREAYRTFLQSLPSTEQTQKHHNRTEQNKACCSSPC